MLIAYTVAVELITELRPIVAAVKRHDTHLADQLRRAATNTVANLAEGQRRMHGNKNRAFENAHGEAREILGCLDTARRGATSSTTIPRGSFSIACSACAGD